MGSDGTIYYEGQPGAYQLVGPPAAQAKPPVTPVTNTTTVWLSSLVPVMRAQSYGTLHDNESIDGNPITSGWRGL